MQYRSEDENSQPSFNRPKRPRIQPRPRTAAVPDPLAFEPNQSSDNARRAFVFNHNVEFDVWFVKHYHDRHHHGDENGKRDGIDPETIKSLVQKAGKYLIACASIVRGFTLLNYEKQSDPVRVVIQDSQEGGVLNVVIIGHLLDLNKFEVTIRTAMVVDDFRIAMGQYVLDMRYDAPVLKRMENRQLVKVFEF